jgi:undecaprenyl-diphosphatase
MQVVQAIILGLVQGFTEFIPVSSSGHLIIIGHYLGFEYSGLAFDVALDIGTLLALALVFARDFWQLGHDAIWGGPQRRLAWFIAAATVPAVVAGMWLQELAKEEFRSTGLVATNLIVVGVLMWVVDRWCRHDRGLASITLPRALGVGVAQALALVPGVSRSGITITAGRLFGLDRVTATRFSFLLSGPVILGATVKVLVEGDSIAQMASAPWLYVAGIAAAFASGYVAIRFLLGYLARHGLALFAGYRIALGLLLLVVGF